MPRSSDKSTEASEKAFRPPRQRRPSVELESIRTQSLGYEAPEDAGFIRCLEHGYPTPLARWHQHDEYELHLIVSTSGKAFVGDWIGQFLPGHLVLTGPGVPHNWVSLDVPEGGVDKRDAVIQFSHEPLLKAAGLFPEMTDVLPLLERARYGIEFFGLSARAEDYFKRVKTNRGLQRIAAFFEFMDALVQCTDYRLLSSAQLRVSEDAVSMDRISRIVAQITADPVNAPPMAELAEQFGMSQSAFSRFFRKETGNTFTDFMTRIRIHRACQLLMESDQYISNICYQVGFNNLANFNRRFVAIKGMTPSDFRRQADRRFESGSSGSADSPGTSGAPAQN
jgi:AraC-like DNA-binding protein